MRSWPALILLAMPLAAHAQAPAPERPIVVSHAPDGVAVTFYRDSRREPGRVLTFDPDDEDPLGGYAMITETRTVDLPPGAATVRFEGVASGIVPQSAILFDADVREKNFDSRLLSQRGLIDAFTGQRVTVRRTDRATGRVVEEPGTILARPDALILHTASGYEAVQCEGSLSTLIFPGVPLDLTARPTLSLVTRPDQPGGRVTLTLAYLAANFDWQANYVATFAPDGQSLRLFGWMTLASRDRTSFVDSAASAVAGVLARAGKTEEEEIAEDEARADDPYAPDNIEISAGCWPSGRTSFSGSRTPLFMPGTLPSFDAPIAVRMEDGDFGVGGCGGEDCDDIIVTARRRTERGDLGDLKLYTIGAPTTVAAQSMKQVRFLEERVVRGETLYRIGYGDEYTGNLELLFRFDNREENGVGEPLPAGQVSLFQDGRHGRQLIGETMIVDKAIDEQVEFKLPDPEGYAVDVDSDDLDSGDDWTRVELTVANGNDVPILFETEFRDTADYRIDRFSERVFERRGKTVWRTTVPAHGERKIRFRNVDLPDGDEE